MLTKEDIDRLKEKWNHDFMVWIDNERKADSPNIALLDEIFSDTEGTPTSCYRLSQILPAELEERRNALRIIEAKEDGYSISEYIVDYVVGSWSQHIINTGDSPEEIMYAAALSCASDKKNLIKKEKKSGRKIDLNRLQTQFILATLFKAYEKIEPQKSATKFILGELAIISSFERNIFKNSCQTLTTRSVYELNQEYKINLSGIWQECHFNISDIALVYDYITTPVSKNGKTKWILSDDTKELNKFIKDALQDDLLAAKVLNVIHYVPMNLFPL